MKKPFQIKIKLSGRAPKQYTVCSTCFKDIRNQKWWIRDGKNYYCKLCWAKQI